MKTKPLFLNPNRFKVSVGQVVHCYFSGRAITVARFDQYGSIWEAMEPTHPALRRNGGSLPDDHQRYIGIQYREFQPAFVRKPKTPYQIERGKQVRWAMDQLHDGADSQAVEVGIYQDTAFIEVCPDDEKRGNVAQGIVRFCEHALGFSRV